jgi:hypothetical protein
MSGKITSSKESHDVRAVVSIAALRSVSYAVETTGRCLDTWALSGEVLLVGTPPANVKLAAFYTGCQDFYYSTQIIRRCSPARLVTNVTSLGPTGGPFTLCLDTSGIVPAPGHYIYLILWADGNDNDVYDPGEDWKYVVPLFEDQAFPGATDCIYYYDDRAHEDMGTEPGWNMSVGLNTYAPIRCTMQAGARLSNEAAWSLA